MLIFHTLPEAPDQLSRKPNKPIYSGSFFRSCQEKLEAAIARGITEEKLETFLVNLYTEQSKIINPSDIQKVSLKTLEQNILMPRQDLYRFILCNWIDHIFLPSLDQSLVDSMLIFGIGRIFSAYSNIGVQYCTDADLNFVLADTIPKARQTKLCAEVKKLKQTIWDLFAIIVEVDTSFTVLKVSDIKKRLAHPDSDARLSATLFYKGNAGSLFVLHDNPEIRANIFDNLQTLPDALLFENFIGCNPSKPTYSRLKKGEVRLSVIADSTREKESVDEVIGTKKFGHQCRHLAGIHPELSPSAWCFSMKYTVNRVYDYVSAMSYAGYSLKEIGFNSPKDPDYQFLSQSHRLMLFLQEIIHIKLDSFNNLCDYSYISAERFCDFISTPKGSFRTDFDQMVLSPNFLLASQRTHYLNLKHAVHYKKELKLSLSDEQMEVLVRQFGIKFRHLDQGSGRTPVAIPYTWGGIGYFVFSAVESRLSSIVKEKLIPAVGLTESFSS